MDQAVVDLYLARIGADRPASRDGEALADLQERHLRAVPFENLSIHLGEEIVLEEAALVDKVVTRGRGGFCYELNGLFAALLRALGFRVTLLAARVNGQDGFGPPFDHLALRVDASEPWLADVGFGHFSHHPLRLDVAGELADPGGRFRITRTADGDLDVLRDGEPQYRIEPRPRALADFEPTCWWHQTSSTSSFTRSLVCSRLTDGGRVTLSGRTLIETAGEDRRERTLATDAEVLDAYRAHFGVVLDRVPSLLSSDAPQARSGRNRMEDQSAINRINELAREEHKLFQKESTGQVTDAEHERLRDLQVELDQCWDLLRQRRARRAAGLDPDEAIVRDEGTVEGYLG